LIVQRGQLHRAEQIGVRREVGELDQFGDRGRRMIGDLHAHSEKMPVPVPTSTTTQPGFTARRSASS